jgi:hypothetical protein
MVEHVRYAIFFGGGGSMLIFDVRMIGVYVNWKLNNVDNNFFFFKLRIHPIMVDYVRYVIFWVSIFIFDVRMIGIWKDVFILKVRTLFVF